MAGTAKDIQVSEVHQGPGDLWVIATPPVDATPRLTLAANGTPDSVTHGACVHLGAIQSAITTKVQGKMAMIDMDQYDSPIDGFATDLEASIEAEMAQTESAKLQRALGVATYATGSGYKHLTFGGTLVVPTLCIAAISPKRTAAAKHIIATLFSAVAVGGFQVAFGRAKSSTYKAKFVGIADLARTAGKQVGIVHETLADASGGTPIAKDATVAEIYQGPGDLWLIDAAPTDNAVRVTLDATTLTPDATAHANAKHLGGTAGEITLTVTPKIGFIRLDQVDAPVGVFIESLEAKIEAEMSQTEMLKLSRTLGVGSYSGDATPPVSWKQVTFGGTDQAASICIAAIAKKRTDATKAGVMCLYRVQPTSGIEITMSRKKQSTYKVSFTGLADLTRTAGKQIGVFHEMI
jgi:hypothetical protein